MPKKGRRNKKASQKSDDEWTDLEDWHEEYSPTDEGWITVPAEDHPTESPKSKGSRNRKKKPVFVSTVGDKDIVDIHLSPRTISGKVLLDQIHVPSLTDKDIQRVITKSKKSPRKASASPEGGGWAQWDKTDRERTISGGSDSIEKAKHKYQAKRKSERERKMSGSKGEVRSHNDGKGDRSIQNPSPQLDKQRGGASRVHAEAVSTQPIVSQASESQNKKNKNKKKRKSAEGDAFPQAQNDERPRAIRGRNANRASDQGRSPKPRQPYERKPVFENYFRQEIVSAGLKTGVLLVGSIRINPRNYEDAYVAHVDNESDIFIRGLVDRNRALNKDVVVLQLYEREKWEIISEPKLGPAPSVTTAIKAEGQAISTPEVFVGADGDDSDSDVIVEEIKDLDIEDSPVKSTPQVVQRQTAASEQHQQKHFQRMPLGKYCKMYNVASDLIPNSCLLRTAKVVYIMEYVHSRATSGHLRPFSDRNPAYAQFIPIDSRVPRMFVPILQCPKDLLQRPQDHDSTLYVARIKDWPMTSKMPFADMCRSLGEAGEIEPETQSILFNCGIDFEEFPEAALDCLPAIPEGETWKIPEEEYEKRRDLRKKCIFTIDPATARDLDDAVSIEKIGDNEYEIGVHIADVSYFVQPRTELDEVARSRATSVYMVQRVIPMLPRLLCEQLCSLNPDEDRLAFSVSWIVRLHGDAVEVLSEDFYRSVIRSCVKLSYEHAQGFIVNPKKQWSADELPEISKPFDANVIQEKVIALNEVAQKLRRKRFKQGALQLNQPKLSFELDPGTGLPSGFYMYRQKDANRLIEEYMLLANMAVARKIYSRYPEISMLRRHQPPQGKQLRDLAKQCEVLGLNMDFTDSLSIQESLDAAFAGDPDEEAKLFVLINLCSKPMQQAEYFCTGLVPEESDYWHYALSVPFYTHFTSPIRRYPDVLVHRLLAASLGYTKDLTWECAEIGAIAQKCNEAKYSAKSAGELSGELFLSVFIKECGVVETTGHVMAILDKSFDVLLIELGVVRRVYCDKLDLVSFRVNVVEGKPHELELRWFRDGQPSVVQIIHLFDKVLCILSPGEKLQKWRCVIRSPMDRADKEAAEAAAAKTNESEK